MNKINPIFEALSNVNDRHILVTREESSSKKLKIILVAAAVAAALALAGFTTSTVRKHLFGFYGEGLTGHSFELNLTPHEITVPEEFMPKPDNFTQNTDIPPSELFEMFGLEYPINDNFTEVNEQSRIDVRMDIDDNTNVDSLEFRYFLFNKSIDQNVIFNARYFSKPDNMTLTSREGLLPKEPNEVITLKDGSLCMITKSKAVFSYDGAHYRFEIDYGYEVPANIGEMTIQEQYQVVDEMIEAMPGMDAVKQVLADLDLL